MSRQTLTSPRGQAMLGYLPPYYTSSRVMTAILQAQGAELDRAWAALDGTLDQAFVGRATWGLDTWERELGLPASPGADPSERRQRVISRLRGTGTATTAVVSQVTQAYQYGRVALIEDHSAYRLTVRFIDTHGVPSDVDDLQLSLRRLIPAHLEVTFEYTYLLWLQLDAMALTWDSFDALGLTWGGLEVYS